MSLLVALLAYLLYDRQRALRRLGVSEERYVRASHFADFGVWEVDLERGVFVADDWLRRYLDYSQMPQQAKVEDWLAAVPPGDRERLRAAYEQARRGEMRRFRFEHAVNTGGGRRVEFETLGEVVERGGRRRLYGLSRDIDDRKQAEAALREQIRSREQTELRYRTLVENIPQGVVVQGGDGQIEFANPAAERILGRTLGQLSALDSRAEDWQCVHEDGSSFPGEMHPAMLALRTRRPVRNILMGVWNPAGQRRVWINVDAVPLFENGGSEVSGVLSSFHDVSEERELQQALVKSQRLEAVGQLTGGIAHDFNNILGSILGFAELARGRYAVGNPKLDRYLAQIETAGGRARDLIRQLLIFSRGERTGEVRSLPLVPLVKENLKMLRPSLPATIEIRSTMATDSPLVRVDPLHVQQLLTNLCINARDAMQRNGVIEIGVERVMLRGEHCTVCGRPVVGEWVRLRVADDGPGIDKEHEGLIFQPFFTTKAVGEGSGMGLAMVRGIVETYGGHVLVGNGPHGGAAFDVLFRPAIPDPLTTEETGQPEAGSGTHELAGRRILLVEDEPAIASYLEDLFGSLGAQVTTCERPADAITRLRAAPEGFDLLLTDQTMPGMTGVELVRTLRSDRPDLAVVMCSGYEHVVGPEILDELAISALLQKPVESNALIAAVSKALAEECG